MLKIFIMNKKILIIAVFVLLLAGCSAPQKVNTQPTNNTDNQEMSTSSNEDMIESSSSDESLVLDNNGLNNFIPLSKGSYWLYRITGEERGESLVEGQEGPIIKTNEQFKVQVLDYAKRDSNLRAALLTGYPGLAKTTSTLIIVSEKNYYLVDGEETFRRIADLKDNLSGLEYGGNLLLPFPLTINKKFGCFGEPVERDDNYYCSWIESIKPADAKLFPNKTQYQISVHTNPDATSFYYVNNVGVTYFSYSHNGTLVEERWNLEKYFIAK